MSEEKMPTYEPINRCIHFSEGELVGELLELITNRSNHRYFWYRDVILQAQDRGYLKVIAHSEDKPFWWRTFEESIELSDNMKQLLERAKNNPK